MSHELKAITIKKTNNKLPLLLNNKIVFKKDILPFKGNVKVFKTVQFQEDVLYESKPGDFLSGDAREITIVNRLNKSDNSSRTIAKCKSHSGEVYEKTSDNITKIIGQRSYDTLFSALCSVINQELRIRGIYSLLTVPKTTNTCGCQVDDIKVLLNSATENYQKKMEVHCQTDESYLDTYKKNTLRRRAKRSQLTPYVIRDVPEQKKPKRLIIPPSNFSTILKNVGSMKKESQKEELPDLGNGTLIDCDSNNSNHSNSSFSALSVTTTPELLDNPYSIIMANVDKVTQEPNGSQKQDMYTLHDFDSGKLNHINNKCPPLNKTVPVTPLHQRMNMVLQQGLYDYNNCLQHDESGHLPIHAAVLTNNLVLLKRQCLVLKMKGISVDLPADNMTPLRMSLYQDNVQITSLLLQYNADVLDSDAQDRTNFHIAAEMATDHLQVLVNHCRLNARKILEESEVLWKQEYAKESDKDLAKILFRHINGLSNEQGYTPLMLAAKLGMYENVKILVETAPDMVNVKMPSSGNTALYLAVGAACMDCTERGNKAKVVDHFRKTIEILVENGADPNSKNFDGTNVNDLLTEYNIGDLSMLIANKMTCRNFGTIGDGKLPLGAKPFDSFMLVKDESGNVDIKKIEKYRKRTIKNSRVAKKSPAVQKVACIPPLNSPKSLIIKSEIIKGDSPTPETV
ncbi:unnamed protein product [Arctia plantaginis]|uniref:Uncharacterized protein n=1 Tax=Arctia plantaginis TaxID=874455 RepID=A0A8S1B792_ARCPL|nr:unnamed protein product [Arctia plantaginis]